MTTRSGLKQPSSTGWSGVVKHLIRSRHALIVMASPQLNGPATCGLEPVKSTVIVPSWTVIAISIPIILFYVFAGRNLNSDLGRQLSWIAAASQAFDVVRQSSQHLRLNLGSELVEVYGVNRRRRH